MWLTLQCRDRHLKIIPWLVLYLHSCTEWAGTILSPFLHYFFSCLLLGLLWSIQSCTVTSLPAISGTRVNQDFLYAKQFLKQAYSLQTRRKTRQRAQYDLFICLFYLALHGVFPIQVINHWSFIKDVGVGSKHYLVQK